MVNGRIIEAATVDLQAPKVGVGRQQRPQQIDRRGNFEEVEFGKEREYLRSAGVEGLAGGSDGADGRHVEVGEDGG